jgi:SAM-dependent methyltransferase
MVGDMFWKLVRKSLSGKLYLAFQKSFLGRFRKYYSFETFKGIAESYFNNVNSLEGKTVLEAGSGLQFFTALQLLSKGAAKVILVDPVFGNRDHLDLLHQHYMEYQSNCEGTPCLNIDNVVVYSSLKLLPSSLDHSIDIICSHFVLEHVTDLKEFFTQSQKLLSKKGLCYSSVDLTDHTYQIFDSRKWTQWLYKKNMLLHLRYSERMNQFLSDRRTWVNRILFPAYIKTANECGFTVTSKKLYPYKSVEIHDDVLKKLPPDYQKEELFVTHFELTLSPF